MGKNTKKAETLGMPHGTASNRLRKSIMFKYVVMAGDNYCFKCGAEIESVSELSIEHKEPWEGVSSDLFFDLDNIAFSHLRCNSGSRRDSGRLKFAHNLTAYDLYGCRCDECKAAKSAHNAKRYKHPKLA